jgi:hypothetical protein
MNKYTAMLSHNALIVFLIITAMIVLDSGWPLLGLFFLVKVSNKEEENDET